MKPKFWLERWQKNQIGFHQAEHNKLLLEFWPQLGLTPGTRVFVPLCGKSLDMCWLQHAGHPVTGVEVVQMAIETFFAEAHLTPDTEVVDRFKRYRVCSHGTQTAQAPKSTQLPPIDIYHGDFFDLTAPQLEGVGAVFDRGALVTLPADMRFRYVDHLLRIVPDDTRILLLTFEYDQNLVAGPPHSVIPEEVEALFGPRCEVRMLDSIVTELLPPHFAEQGVNKAAETVYCITKNA